MLGTGTDGLYMLDSTTGAVTARIGAATRFGVNELQPHGLAWHNGRLYMTGYFLNSLYTLDVTTGEATRIVIDVPGILTGVASHNGELYAIARTLGSNATGRFYSVDLDTSTFTRIGGDDFGVDETSAVSIASHGSPAVLYMIGSDTDALYTLDAATGMAARVGSSQAFGVDEHKPSELSSHAGSLYMTGSTHDALYELDTITGEAARVGTSQAFGISEHYPGGIASGYRMPEGFALDAVTGEIAYTGGPAVPGVHVLYVQVSDGKDPDAAADAAVDDAVRVTVTVPDQAPVFSHISYGFGMLPGTDGTGTARPVGAVTAADPEGDAVSYSLESVSASDSVEPVYMTGDSSDALYTVDVSTGAVTRVGAEAGFGANVTEVRGLGWHNGQLYLVGGTASEGDGIYTVDTTTGVAARVARMSDLGTGYRPPTAVDLPWRSVVRGVLSRRDRQTVQSGPSGGHRRPDRR